MSRIPYFSNFVSNIGWLIVSSALDKSIKIPNVSSLSFLSFASILFKNWMIGCIVVGFGLNPYWCLDICSGWSKKFCSLSFIVCLRLLRDRGWLLYDLQHCTHFLAVHLDPCWKQPLCTDMEAASDFHWSHFTGEFYVAWMTDDILVCVSSEWQLSYLCIMLNDWRIDFEEVVILTEDYLGCDCS